MEIHFEDVFDILVVVCMEIDFVGTLDVLIWCAWNTLEDEDSRKIRQMCFRVVTVCKTINIYHYVCVC